MDGRAANHIGADSGTCAKSGLDYRLHTQKYKSNLKTIFIFKYFKSHFEYVVINSL